MLSYHNDKTIKFQHTPVINKTAFPINQIGACGNIDIEPATSGSYDDDNSIFVSDTTGNDTTGAGTQANPYKTLLKGINSTTATKTKVMVLDSALYNEDLSSCTYTYCQGIFATTGTPQRTSRTLGFTPSDSNSIFVSQTSGGSGATGTESDPVSTIAEAITLCDTAHNSVVIMDSEEYTEEAFEFAGSFTGLYAAQGETPTIIISESNNATGFSVETDVAATLHAGTPSGAAASYCRNIALPDGKILLIYDWDYSGLGQYYIQGKILNSDLTVYKAETTIQYKNTNMNLREAVLLDDGENVAIFYYDAASAAVRAMKLNISAWTLSGDAVIVSSNVFFHATLTSAGIVGCYGETHVIIDPTDFSVDYSDAFGSDYFYHRSVTTLDNGNVMFFGYYQPSLMELCYLVWNPETHAVVTARTELGVSESTSDFSVDSCVLSSGAIFLYWEMGTAGTSHYRVLDFSDYSIVASWDDTIAEDYPSCCTLESGNVFVQYSTGSGYYYKRYRPLQTRILVSAAATINGINFETESGYMLREFINCDGSELTVKYCKFSDINADLTADYDAVAIKTDDTLTVDSCIFADNDLAISATSNDVDIQNSLFYRHNGGYAITIDGAGTGIIIEHNDIFQNYGGVDLTNNDGDEVVKNNNIHSNSNFSIDADTSLTVTNSAITGTNNNVTLGSYAVRSNPLYVNEGAINPDDIDLNVKVRVLGYPTDSPALNLGDDSRNSGAYDVRYIGQATSWTTITVAKPYTINVDYISAGGVSTQRRDGTYSAYDDAMTEVVSMNWVGILNADYDLLLKMRASRIKDVRIYPDPVTYPNSYSSYTLLPDDFTENTKYYPLSRTGKSDVSLKFARDYQEV